MSKVGEEQLKALVENAAEYNDCPIKPLGAYNGAYYFMSGMGEIRRFRPNDMNEAGFQSLFDGNLEWLQEYFPMSVSGGRAATGCEFNVPAARAYFIRLCSLKGLFDDTIPVRRVGVWPSKLNNQIIIHCGDTVFIGGEWQPAGFETDGAIYPAVPPIKKPADTPASLEGSRFILDTLKSWNFELPQGPEIALGLLGQAYIAGALNWKSHGLFYGSQGSGKTTLARFIAAALGPMAHAPTNNYTEAGLRQTMSNQSRTLLLDEMEHDSGSGSMRAVIKMIRQMSSGEGANIQRGSPGGQAQNFRLNGAVMMFCIHPTHLEPQDRARITRLKIKPLSLKTLPDIENRIKQAEALSLKLWRRAIDRIDHFQNAFAGFKGNLMSEGLTARAADQIATILAGADILLYNHPPEDADSWQERMQTAQPLIQDWQWDEEENEGQQCLTKLYSSLITPYGREEKTIATMILEGMDSQSGNFARDALKQIGILIKDYHTQAPHLLIANNHEGLSRVFKGSKWEGGGWITALRYLDEVTSAPLPVRFSGVLSRATIIPSPLLPQKGE